jgi:hypothetical protein
MATFYRVLYSAEHYQALHEKRNSSHHRPPWAWTSTWAATHSLKPDDYRLWCEEALKMVKFSENALKAFLRYAPSYPDGQPWTSNEHLTEAGELDGVCVFLDPAQCFLWGEAETGQGRHEYVVLTGSYVCDVPENSGMVIQQWVLKDGPLPPAAFKTKYIDTPGG